MKIADNGDASHALKTPVFRKISRNGFGDGFNSYAHSMAWFRDQIFVGITRANLCMIKVNNPPSFSVWPIKCPDDVYDLDRRAQIWSYDPRTETWRKAFVSPLVKSGDGKKMARDLGYRGMSVFHSAAESSPALYVCSWSPSRTGRPALIMRSTDGVGFQTVLKPGSDPTLNTYRALVPCNDRLYTSPGGKTFGWQGSVYQGADSNMSNAAVVLESANPASDAWRPVSDLGFGDAGNVTLFEMAAFNGCLYVGTMNPAHGFQVWKSKLAGKPPYKWTKVLTNGAYRGRRNECTLSFCVFNNALYVGTGIQNGGFDRANKVGPAAAEVIRIHPDDSWDLIVGDPRRTAYGLKLPLSGMGPGFDDFFNGYIWRMAVHDGWLYAGTFNWSVLLPYLKLELWPEMMREPAERLGVDNLVSARGGFDLWRSCNGVDWTPVTRDGFGNRYNYGVRTLQSTPFGLFVGTANPFGPEHAVKTANGWDYAPNPSGGAEVWVGTAEPSMRERAQANGHEYLTLAGDASFEELPTSTPIGEPRVMSRIYDSRMYDELVDTFYGRSGFNNFGYWEQSTRSPKEACENLMERLLSLIPEKSGRVLDVGCGKGATTQYLLNYYEPSRVTGINISEKQLETCKASAPDCAFHLMDATQLDFEDQSFDNIICVESALHFDSKEDFLFEAFRVLKPGGRLVLSDILYQTSAMEQFRGSARNYVRNSSDYETLYHNAGFREIKIEDATSECSQAFWKNAWRFARDKFASAEVTRGFLESVRRGMLRSNLSVRSYVLVSARKPLAN